MKYLTHFRLSMKSAIGVVSMVSTLPLVAIENPVAEVSPEQKTPQLEKGNQGEVLKGKKVAVLGVGGSPVSESLSSHLGIEPGQGMVLTLVEPNSAAARMGLKVHDVIIEFDGQPITNQQSLKNAVLSRKPGDEATVAYIHQSEKKEAKVALGGRVVMFDINTQPESEPKLSGRLLGGNLGGNLGGTLGGSGLGHLHQADRKAIEQRMKNHMDEMRRQLQGNIGMELDLNKILEAVKEADQYSQGAQSSQGIHDKMGNMPPPQSIKPSGHESHGRTMSFSSSSSITHRDKEGHVTMKTMNGVKQVIVKDLQGKVLYEGPYQTDQDKAAISENIRQRLDAIDLSNGQDNSYRLHIQGGVIKLSPDGR